MHEPGESSSDAATNGPKPSPATSSGSQVMPLMPTRPVPAATSVSKPDPDSSPEMAVFAAPKIVSEVAEPKSAQVSHTDYQSSPSHISGDRNIQILFDGILWENGQRLPDRWYKRHGVIWSGV